MGHFSGVGKSALGQNGGEQPLTLLQMEGKAQLMWRDPVGMQRFGGGQELVLANGPS